MRIGFAGLILAAFVALVPCAAIAAPYDLTNVGLDPVTGAPLPPTVDPNGLMLNPMWSFQTTSVANFGQLTQHCVDAKGNRLPEWLSPCTTATTWSDEKAICGVGHRSAGHENWGVEAFSGRIFWSDKTPVGQDDDYNFDMVTDVPNAALTVDTYSVTQSSWNGQDPNNPTPPPSLHLEFDSDETIDHFHTSWWSALKNAVDNGDANPNGVNGLHAIAIGVLGMDCAHFCGMELHPIYALAIHIQDSPTDDRWAYFARNSGNEGWCSSGSEDWETEQISFLLKRQGALDVQWKSDEILYGPDDMSASDKAQVAGPIVLPIQSIGALLMFQMPGPRTGVRMNGTVDLQWTMPPPRPEKFQIAEPEEINAARLARLAPATRAAYSKFLSTLEPCHVKSPLPGCFDSLSSKFARREPLSRMPAVKPAPVRHAADVNRDKLDAGKMQELGRLERAKN